MKKKLVFCQGSVAESWVLYKVAAKTRRRLRGDRCARIQQVFAILNQLCSEGLGLTCTVSAAAGVVTTLYKGDLPLEGETGGFPIRKYLAREAAQTLRENFELLAPNASHFRTAEELWLAWCLKGIKAAYAQFADYIDVALVLNPPEETTISHVFVDHPHIPYILGKSGAQQIIYHV